MTEAIHDPVGCLSTLPQKLRQGHDSRPLVFTLKQKLASKETSRRTLQETIKRTPQIRTWTGTFFFCQVCQDHNDRISCAFSEDISALGTRPVQRLLQCHIGDLRNQCCANPAESERAESLSAQPLKTKRFTLEVRMETRTHSDTHTFTQVQLLTVQSCSSK
ncbi:hypothetical protein ILYODFUR_034250 [Ilyodon furcidens]|uniref:Uncharacterized protein n=1 Tax=Ilyodon furcidens TaxID=33524 RepID=A0ABV0U1V6_9TELE